MFRALNAAGGVAQLDSGGGGTGEPVRRYYTLTPAVLRLPVALAQLEQLLAYAGFDPNRRDLEFLRPRSLVAQMDAACAVLAP